MENHDTRRSRLDFGMWFGVMVLFIFCAADMAVAQDTSLLSGESSTIFRTMQSTNNDTLAPAYEYLHFSAPNLDRNGRFSLDVGGWGRTDLGYRSTKDYHDGDLQYGYVSYRGPSNNLAADLGRQFVTEGVASEKLDGLYLRSDFKAGFGAAAFVGAPVVTEPNSGGGSLIYGGRLTNSMSKYYTIGISALKVNCDGVNSREEEGVDIWFHPLTQIDIVGRSSYNSITGGWMEHDYQLTYSPRNNLSINANTSDIKYRAYFFNMTTDVFSLYSATNRTGLLDPNERAQATGASVVYSPKKKLVLTADYKNHHHAIAGDANYFGGKATVLLPEGFMTGLSIHRMDGSTDKLRYSEYRVFTSKKIKRFDFTGDYIETSYDNQINGVNNSHTLVGAVSYQIKSGLKFSADIDYYRNPYYDNNVAGLFKITYAFDARRGTEGSAK